MTKRILLAVAVATITFSGCTCNNVQPKETVKKELTKKADVAKEAVAKKVDVAKETASEVKKAESVAPALPESTMKDKVEEQIIESVVR